MGDPVIKRRKKRVKHRFYVPASRFDYPKDGGQPVVNTDRDTTHHIRNVLRLGTGAKVVIFDNSGAEYEGEITDCRPSQATIKIERATNPRTESPVNITIAQALLKGNGFDRVLTLCAELGCDRFVPLFTSRTVTRLNRADAPDRIKRWERIVAEASAQCGRVKVPALDAPVDLKDFLEEKRIEGTRIILWERGGSGQLGQILDAEDKLDSVTLLVGPEGGFSQSEVKQAMDAGFSIWGLGPRTLRSETVGSVAIGLLQFAIGDMG